MTTDYVFDQGWQKERDRLGALESLFDGTSQRLLAGFGVGEGWRCLEVGCGAGGLALWLADMVGETGRVLATDLDTRFLDGHGRANLDVRTHNVVTDPVEEARFDLIHARAVLEHLPDRQQVLKRLVAALRPGGWLLIEDTDFGDPASATLAQYVSAASARELFEQIYRACATLFARKGAESTYGRALPAALVDAGLTSVAAEVHTPVVTGGSEQWARGTVEQLAPVLVGAGLATEADIERFLAITADPEVFYVCPLMVSAWGQRPR
jgi:SAM-dependent methyltransferase